MTELERLFAEKRTENGDVAYNTTGDNPLLDIFFMSEYYEKHPTQALDAIRETKKYTFPEDMNSPADLGYYPEQSKLFSMFMRDARYGLGRRTLGRILMEETKVSPENVVKAGRYDDLLYHYDADQGFKYLVNECKKGNQLAKKWMPRLNCQNPMKMMLARKICKVCKLTEKEYRKLIKVDTTESLLSSKRLDEINFEQVPSLAMLKYWKRFMKEERFQKYLEKVKSGEKKINTSIVNIYDLYLNLYNLGAEADLYWDKMKKINISCIPIVDTSGSMNDGNHSMAKAVSIGYYLAKCSSFCNGQVISFSKYPQLINVEGNSPVRYGRWSDENDNPVQNPSSKIAREMSRIYTGDCTNTDFGAVMNLLKGLQSYPDYFVVLSDMEFDCGSSMSKENTMNMFEKTGVPTKIVWWNFNGRNTTVPEIDKYGNIYMSGYNPTLLKYLEAGFDGNQFLDNLLQEYKKNIDIQ